MHTDLKDDARERVRAAYPRCHWEGSALVIRINGLSTSWGEKDLRMVRELASVAAVVPKAEDRSVVAEAVTIGGVPLLLMIETAKGVLAAEALAESSGVEGLVFGAADYRDRFCAGRTPDEDELGFARSQILHAARAAGVDVFDTLWFECKDLVGLETSAKCAPHGVRRQVRHPPYSSPTD